VAIANGIDVAEPAPHPEPKSARFSGKDLASRILRYMASKGYKIFEGPQEYNIVYVEGMNIDGSLNADAPNKFNDIRLVIEVVNGQPKIVGGPWIATTEPSRLYTNRPLNARGAARIAFEQYAAWQVGDHKGHEALVQTGGKVTVYRDLDKNGYRTGDKLDTGFHGINQHHGYNNSKENIGTASAGCLVGRSIKEHEQFMSVIKQDRRYQKDHQFVFTTTILAGDGLVKQFPA
ncbi:MAG: peptidoglycan-binding protein, partial [Phormidesmis sp.]